MRFRVWSRTCLSCESQVESSRDKGMSMISDSRRTHEDMMNLAWLCCAKMTCFSLPHLSCRANWRCKQRSRDEALAQMYANLCMDESLKSHLLCDFCDSRLVWCNAFQCRCGSHLIKSPRDWRMEQYMRMRLTILACAEYKQDCFMSEHEVEVPLAASLFVPSLSGRGQGLLA